MKKILAKKSWIAALALGLAVSGATTTALAQGNITQVNESVLDVGMVTEAAASNGSLRVLIAAANNDTTASVNNNDGVPDVGFFDYGGGAANSVAAVCPSGVANYTFSGSTSTPNAIYMDTNNKIITDLDILNDITAGTYDTTLYTSWHSFVCQYTGTGAIGTVFQTNQDGSSNTGIVIGNAGAALVNPARDPADQTAMEDGTIANSSIPVRAFLQNLDSAGDIVSSSEVIISAMANEVVVSAHMVGEISFKITGVPEGSQSGCLMNSTDNTNGIPTGYSTATLIDFGSPTLNTWATAVQQLQVVSSANGGYSVSVAQRDQMGRSGAACPGADGMLDEGTNPRVNRDCIPDFTDATTTVAAAWTDPQTQKGLGYTVARSYYQNDLSSTGADFTSPDMYRQLADVSESEDPAVIATSTGKTDYDVYEICYKITPDAANNAGTYQNQIDYYVTANF
jgi:hypothetical protein